MPGDSSIEWTDKTWNFITGCTRVSAGCDRCYAFTLHDKRHEAWKAGNFPTAPKQYHKPFSEVQVFPDRIAAPLEWRKPCRVFVNSMSDFWHTDVPDDILIEALAIMALTPQHTYQILTKRPQRMARTMASDEFRVRVAHQTYDFEVLMPLTPAQRRIVPKLFEWPLPNVWMGVSVENQEAAFRLDFLVKTPAAVRFVSAEPLLGSVDFHKWMPGLDWIIAGGESGPGHRPCDPDWVRSIRDQCLDYHVPFFFKQWGGITPKAGGRLLDGREWNEMPERRV